MINFIDFSLLEATAKEFKQTHGDKHFNTTTVHNSKKLVHFIKVGNKITNAHYFHKNGDEWRHIKSEKKED